MPRRPEEAPGRPRRPQEAPEGPRRPQEATGGPCGCTTYIAPHRLHHIDRTIHIYIYIYIYIYPRARGPGPWDRGPDRAWGDRGLWGAPGSAPESPGGRQTVEQAAEFPHCRSMPPKMAPRRLPGSPQDSPRRPQETSQDCRTKQKWARSLRKMYIFPGFAPSAS